MMMGDTFKKGYYNQGNYNRGKWSGARNQNRFWKNSDPYKNNDRSLQNGIFNKNEIGVAKDQNDKSNLEPDSPYEGWKIYFPEEIYKEESDIAYKIKSFLNYFTVLKMESDVESRCFNVDIKDMLNFFASSIPNLSQDLECSPEIVLNCLCVAAFQLLNNEMGARKFLYTNQVSYTAHLLNCRISNFPIYTSLKLVKANYYGKFISLKGTVVRVECTKPICIQMAYKCGSCSYVQGFKWPKGKCSIPNKCPEQRCRGKSFVALRGHTKTLTVDHQNIRVQEQMNDENREAGRIPRTIECELMYDLVDRCTPGDIITVSGIVKVTTANDDSFNGKKEQCLFSIYLEVNNISQIMSQTSTQVSINTTKNESQLCDLYKPILNHSQDQVCRMGDRLTIDFTIKDLYDIEEIQSDKQLFRLLVGSLCPTIYGHEIVKAGLLLSLFSGTQRFADKNTVPIRGDIHILIVGDPGLGKSQMLQSVSNLAPRSVMVCANTTTTSGLTVTLTKEAGGRGDNVLEAGALVLADHGTCCIDEFDKMTNQHQALLEAMEQQSISIAKAGIVCSLPARTSIVAAANPSGGHYNKAKTVSENLRMGGALLSRFDLVFIILDKPDEDMDSRLSEHVMSLHTAKSRSQQSTPASKLSKLSGLIASSSSSSIIEGIQPLSKRLKVLKGQEFKPIPSLLLRKFIGYAKLYVNPKLGKEAANVLQEFYLNIRKNHHTKNSTPITTRQLESMIRLTEARAKLELREEATKQDALDVIEIMKYSMIDTYSDETGVLNFERSQHGSGSSNKAQAKKFIQLLQKSNENNGKSIFSVQEMKNIIKKGVIQVKDFEAFLASLNDQGYILKKGPKLYKLQIIDG